MDKKIHVPTPNEVEGEQRVETEIEDIEKSFFGILVHYTLNHVATFLLYTALVGFGAWLAFFYIRTYAADVTEKEEEETHG